MSFGGLIGIDLDITHKSHDDISVLFAEEVGWVLEIDEKNVEAVVQAFKVANVPFYKIGKTSGFGMDSKVS